MQHPVPFVAEERFLPEQELVEFANANQAKYGIHMAPYGDSMQPWVGTWHVDDMVRDFKAQNAALCERVRAEKTKAISAAAARS